MKTAASCKTVLTNSAIFGYSVGITTEQFGKPIDEREVIIQTFRFDFVEHLLLF
jgi:hypothetical protein